jgi:hypothetical protein
VLTRDCRVVVVRGGAGVGGSGVGMGTGVAGVERAKSNWGGGVDNFSRRILLHQPVAGYMYGDGKSDLPAVLGTGERSETQHVSEFP